MTKRMKTALCILLIAAVLSTAAVLLLSGSGNGYETVFKAGVKSLLDKESVTIRGRHKLYQNGETESDDEFVWMVENGGKYIYEVNHLTGKSDETYYFQDKRYYNIDHENRTYEFYDYDWNSADVTEEADENTEDTIVNIVKLFSDFFMGNAKNQFVREPIENGNRYTLMLKTEQMPDIFRLFLNLFNESEDIRGVNDYFTIKYMDEKAAVRAYYKKVTGEEMDEKVFDYRYGYWEDWANEDNNLLNKAYADFTEEMRKMYTDMGEAVSDIACVLVYEDGSAEVYASRKDMCIQRLTEGKPLPEYMDALDYPSNAQIRYIRAEFDVSDEGYITHIVLKAEGSVQDVLNETVSYVFEAEYDFENYNSTKISLFDVDQYTAVEDDEISYEPQIKTDTVEFLGKTYTVNYEERVEE